MSLARANGKSGFTLIEILVAALLLGILMTILTMIFNSSAIAWRAGKAGVSQLSKARQDVARYQRRANNTLPRRSGLTQVELASPWSKRTFGVEGATAAPGFSEEQNGFFGLGGSRRMATATVSSGNAGQSTIYAVGVWSCGPDGKEDGSGGGSTFDDITTWYRID